MTSGKRIFRRNRKMAENENKMEMEQEDKYLAAKRAQYEAERRPSKVHELALISFVEENGTLYPVYRKQE